MKRKTINHHIEHHILESDQYESDELSKDN